MGWLSVSTAAGAAFSTTLGFLIEVVHTNRRKINEARNQDIVSQNVVAANASALC